MNFLGDAAYVLQKHQDFLLADIGLCHVPREIRTIDMFSVLRRLFRSFWLYRLFVLGGGGGLCHTGNCMV